jgi:hypothetical protein
MHMLDDNAAKTSMYLFVIAQNTDPVVAADLYNLSAKERWYPHEWHALT